jgi:hypothetical protein
VHNILVRGATFSVHLLDTLASEAHPELRALRNTQNIVFSTSISLPVVGDSSMRENQLATE